MKLNIKNSLKQTLKLGLSLFIVFSSILIVSNLNSKVNAQPQNLIYISSNNDVSVKEVALKHAMSNRYNVQSLLPEQAKNSEGFAGIILDNSAINTLDIAWLNSQRRRGITIAFINVNTSQIH